MDRRLICIERPALGWGIDRVAETDHSMMRIYIPIGVDEYIIVHPFQNTYWTHPQSGYCCRAKLRQMKVFTPVYNNGAFSFDDGAWDTADVGKKWQNYKHNNENPALRAEWTADDDYDEVYLMGEFWATYGTAVITVESGTATIVPGVSPVDEAVSFEDANPFDQKWLKIATDVANGAVIKILPGTGEQFRFAAIIGVKSPTVAVDPDAGDDPMYLVDGDHKGFLVVGTPDDTTTVETLGIDLAMRFEGDTIADNWWGSAAHCDSADYNLHTVTQVLTYYDAGDPTGAAWEPAIGARDVVRALRIVTSGTMQHDNQDIGDYKQTDIYSATGWITHWEITFNSDAADDNLLVKACYCAMWSLNDQFDYASAPQGSAPVALVADDGSFAATHYGNTMYLYGPNTKNTVAIMSVGFSDDQAGAAIKVEQQSGTANKIYCEQPAMAAVADGQILECFCARRFVDYAKMGEMAPWARR